MAPYGALSGITDMNSRLSLDHLVGAREQLVGVPVKRQIHHV
jgi:hypothetical protein